MDRGTPSDLDTYDAHTILLAGLIYDMREVLAWLLCALGVIGVILAISAATSIMDEHWSWGGFQTAVSLYSFGCAWSIHKRRSKYRGISA